MTATLLYTVTVLGTTLASGWYALLAPVVMGSLALAAARKPKERRAAIYVRISRDRPTEVSTQVQERDARAYCRMKGWTVAEVYKDIGISASKRDVVRPAYQRMLHDVDAGLLDVIVIWKLDRLGRSVIELNRVAEQLRKQKVDLASINDSIDTSTPGGRFVYTVFAALAQLESEQIALRVSAASDFRARAGKPHGGARTFGYEKDGVTIREDERAMLLEVARRVVAGETVSDLAREWTAKKIPTPTGRGKRWWPANMVRILTNDHVAGIRLHNGEIIPGTWEPIITPELRQGILERFADPHERATGRNNRTLLSGVIYCAACGRRMAAGDQKSRQNKKVRRYRCRAASYGTGSCGHTFITAEPLEKHVRELVFAFLTDTTFRRALKSGRRADDIERLQAEVDDLQDRLNVLREEFAEGGVDVDAWRHSRQTLRERLDAKQTELYGAVAAAEPDAPDVPDTIEGLQAWWETADQADRRALIRSAITRIEVGKPTRPGPFDISRVKIVPRV